MISANLYHIISRSGRNDFLISSSSKTGMRAYGIKILIPFLLDPFKTRILVIYNFLSVIIYDDTEIIKYLLQKHLRTGNNSVLRYTL